jgi:hypothetical protein
MSQGSQVAIDATVDKVSEKSAKRMASNLSNSGWQTNGLAWLDEIVLKAGRKLVGIRPL